MPNKLMNETKVTNFIQKLLINGLIKKLNNSFEYECGNYKNIDKATLNY